MKKTNLPHLLLNINGGIQKFKSSFQSSLIIVTNDIVDSLRQKDVNNMNHH